LPAFIPGDRKEERFGRDPSVERTTRSEVPSMSACDIRPESLREDVQAATTSLKQDSSQPHKQRLTLRQHAGYCALASSLLWCVAGQGFAQDAPIEGAKAPEASQEGEPAPAEAAPPAPAPAAVEVRVSVEPPAPASAPPAEEPPAEPPPEPSKF